MAINLVKLEDDLKNLPEQNIIGYIQNPNGQVPTYLALAELERRKRMRQGAMAGPTQEQPTVADQLVSEAQPQMQGVASLPVQNVGNEAAYAAGGIVAFEDGGSVQRYNGEYGSFIQLSPEEYAKLTPEQRAIYYEQVLKQPTEADKKYAERRKSIISGAKTLGGLGLDYLTLGPRKMAEYGDYMRGLGAEGINTVMGREVFDPTPMTSGEWFPSYKGSDAEQTTPQTEADPGNKKLLEQMKSTVIPRPASDIMLPPGANKDVVKTPPGPGADRVPSPPATQGLGGLPTWKDYNPKLLDASIYDAELANRPSMAASTEEMNKLREAYGIPLDPYGAQQVELANERKALEGQKDRNIGQFLMELGGGLASTPGPFGAAFGASILKAAPGLIANQKDLRKEQRDLRKEAAELERLDNARKEALMQGDRAEYQRLEQRYDNFRAKSQDRKDANIKAVNEANFNNQKIRYDTALKVWEVNTEEAGKTARANIEASSTKELANQLKRDEISRKVAEGRSKYRLERMEQNPQIMASQSQLMSLENKPDRNKEEEAKLKQLKSGLAAYMKKIDKEYEDDLINSGYPIDIVRSNLPAVSRGSHPADIENILKSLGV